MSIVYHEKTREFHLYNDKISYIFQIMRNGQLGQLYTGARLRDREDFSHLSELGFRDMAPCVYEGDRFFSLEALRQEYPAYGTGDMRYPAYELLRENGSRLSGFVYQSHRIYPGKPKLPGLPATYVEKENEAETLEITLKDELIGTELILSYTIYEAFPAVCRNACFRQTGEETVVLDEAMSLSLDLPDRDYDLVTLTGAWAERTLCPHGTLKRGRPGSLQHERPQQPSV